MNYEWAWVVNVSLAVAAVWDECTCEVAGDAKCSCSFLLHCALAKLKLHLLLLVKQLEHAGW